VLSLGGGLVYQSARAQTEQLEIEAATRAEEIATHIDRELTSALNMLTALGSAHSLQSGDLDTFHSQVVSVAQQLDIWIALRDVKMNKQILNSLTARDAPVLNGMPEQRAQLENEVLRTGQAGISKMFMSSIWKQFIVTVVMPIWRDGEIAYTMTLAIPTIRFVSTHVTGAQSAASVGKQSTVSIIDPDGLIVARSPDHQRFVGTVAEISPSAGRTVGVGARYMLSHEEPRSFHAQSKTKIVDWTVDVSPSRSELLAPIRQAMTAYVAAGGTLFFVAMALAFFVGGRIERATGALGIDREPTREELGALFNSSITGALVVDPNRVIVLASKRLETMFGYDHGELIGEPADRLFSEQLDFAVARSFSGTEDGRAIFGRRKDGGEFPIEVGSSSLKIGNGKFFEAAVVDISERRLTEERLARAVSERDQMRRRLMQAQEDERLRLARDLHDQTGQSLAAAMLDLKGLESQVWELRPAAIDELGLASALLSYVEEWGKQFGIAVDFHCRDTTLDAFPVDIRTTIYRLMQEGLTNIAKHASDATSVSVVIDRLGTTLQLTIEDDGPGFDTSVHRAGSRSAGLGIAGMRERLSLLGGELQIDTGAGRGTTVYARIPIEPERLIA
jgi:two-component system, NarL family, sensor histidine kinase UhpB